MIPISVFIIAKNESDRIGKVIDSVKSFANEIILIDSGSSDNTCEIAQSKGVKVIFNEWNGYGQQKIFGENQCKNDWILNIDADEEVSRDLNLEIKNIFSKQQQPDIAGYKIKIVNKFRFEESPKKLAYYYNQFRLYNKKYAGFKNSSIHDSVELRDKKFRILQLTNIVYHQSFRSFSHWIEKANSYSQMQAIESFRAGKSPSLLKIFFTPTFAFLKAYIVRRYFIYGVDGIIYSYIFAFSRFLKMIKTRELFLEDKFINKK